MKTPVVLIGVVFTVLAFGQQAKNQYFITSPLFHKIEEIKFKNPDRALSLADSILKGDPMNFKSDAYAVKAYVDLIRFKYESAFLNIKKSIEIDSINKDSTRLSRGYNLLGTYYKNISLKDSSLYYNKKAIKFLPAKQTKLLGLYHYDMSGSYAVFGEKIKYIESLKEAKKYSEIAKDTLNLLLIEEKENTLFKKDLGHYTAGRKIYLYSSTTSNPYLISLSQFHYASGLSKYKDSLKIANKYNDSALVYFKKINDNYNMGLASMLGASLAKRLDLKEKVISIYSDYYEILKHSNHDFKYATIYNIGTYYADNKLYDKAEGMFLEVLNENKDKNIQPMLIALVHQALSGLYEEKGRLDKALQHHKNFKQLEDTLYDNRITNQINDFNIKYQTEQKEKENLQLKAEKAEQETLLALQTKRNWQLGGGLATTVLGLGIFFIAYRKNQKQKKEIESQKNKVEHLQKELHHRLKNNLSFIDVFISLAKGKFTDPAYQEKLNELQNRIKSMFEIHEQLFRKEDITSVNAENYILKLTENVKAAYANPNISVQHHIDPDAELDSQTSFPLGIIINEFVTNSYKHAFNPNQHGIIKIELNGTPETYRLTLSDNGKGFSSNFDVNNSNTFGLDSIKLLALEYNGTFSLSGDQGVTLEITLPKPITT